TPTHATATLSLHDALPIYQGVHRDVPLPHAEVRGRGQLALDDQVGGLEEAALLGQLLDRVAAVAEDAALAVDVADLALASGRVRSEEHTSELQSRFELVCR